MFKPNLKVKECWDGKKFNYVSTLQATDSRDEDTNIKDLWNWWRNDKLVNIINMIKPVTWFSTRKPKYPSTLWVTVKPVSPPTSSEPTLRWHQMTFDDIWWHVMTCDDTLSVLRSMAATVPEQSQLLGPTMAGDQDQETQETALAWSRLPGQACRIPSHLLTSLESGARWGVDSTMHYGNLGGHHLQHFYYGLRAISRTQGDFPKCNLGLNMLPGVLGSNGKPLKWLRKRLKWAST